MFDVSCGDPTAVSVNEMDVITNFSGMVWIRPQGHSYHLVSDKYRGSAFLVMNSVRLRLTRTVSEKHDLDVLLQALVNGRMSGAKQTQVAKLVWPAPQGIQ